MKKLLALAFMVFLVTGAFAQTAYFNAGTVNGIDTLVVSPGKWVQIDIWFTGTFPPVALENMNFPLGIKVAQLDTLTGGDIYSPIFDPNPLAPQWDVKEFPPASHNDDVTEPINHNPLGYRSLTFLGFARSVHADSPLLYGTGVPIKIFSYMVHTSDTVTVGQTFLDLLISGVDASQGVMNVGDSTGAGGFPVDFTGCPIYFSPNQPPTIDPEDVFTMPYDCGYTDFTVFVDIFDNDGDVLDVTVNYGTITPFATGGGDPMSDSVTYTYKIDFDMEDFCGDCASFTLEITADDGVNDPATVYTYADEVTIIGEIVASMHNVWLLPGETDWMNVYLDACGDCFCLGGFVFSIEYDASVLSILDVEAGAALAGGEYWNVVYNFDGPGTIRVVFINDLNNQEIPRQICDIDPQAWLFRMEFLLSPAFQYPTNFCSPICFMFDALGENHYDYNTVSDEGGYHVWINDGCDDAPDSTEYGTLLLTMECGNIKFLDIHNVLLGDLNLNGYANEVGDVVLMANHLIDPVMYPFTLRQMYASDANGDGYQASIADLIYMIIGLSGGKVAPLDVVATIAMPADASGNVDITVSSEVNVGGALVSINHTGVELGVPVVDGMNIDYRDNGDVMTVLVFGDKNVSFAPGTNVLFTVPVLSEGTISFGEVSVSDNRGALLRGGTSYEAQLPIEFAVSQNYPNPFNAKTSFRLNVPVESDLTVNIYNVAGQLVKAMDMHLIAGVHSVVWDASDVASGVYFYKVTADDFTKTMKMTLLK
jgi:hypothetical protein